jgi:2,3-bisphosphoglycerate-dependent phosphoglycerate mutase
VTSTKGALIVLRHGESRWNATHRFTGWADPGLTRRGYHEAAAAGRALADAHLQPDIIFTSVLRRACETVAGIRQAWQGEIPLVADWRLNERHYGVLEGLTHDQGRRRYGEDRIQQWRRSWTGTPPPLAVDDPRHPRHHERYSHIPLSDLPASESLATCLRRQLPYVDDFITPLVSDGKSVLLVGHGNSLRALIAHLAGVPREDVPSLLVPTGVPIVYRRQGGWRRDPSRFSVHGTVTGP